MSGVVAHRRPIMIGRDMAWLTAERGRLYAAAAAMVFVGILAAVFLGQGLYTRSGLPVGMDFAGFWAASRLIWAGMTRDVYSPALHMLAQTVIVHGGPYQAFFYPPPYLLLCAPLAGLPFFWSLGAFMAVTGLAYAAAIRLAARSRWVILAAVASPAVLVNLLVGQNAMLTAAILGAGLTLLDRRPRTAGLILGLMVIKPHLALAVPIALLVSRRWTVLGFAALSAVLVAAVSLAVFGVDVWHAFAADAGYPRRTLEQGLVRFELFQSAFAFTRQLGGSIPAAYTAQAVSAIAGLGLMVLIYSKRPSPAAERSAIVLASLLMTPYIIHYDLVILMVPLVWLLTEWTDTGFPPWGKLVLITGYLLPCAIYCWPSLHLGLLGMFGLLAFVAGRAGLRAAIPGAAVPA